MLLFFCALAQTMFCNFAGGREQSAGYQRRKEPECRIPAEEWSKHFFIKFRLVLVVCIAVGSSSE